MIPGYDFTPDGVSRAFELVLDYVGRDWFEHSISSLHQDKTHNDANYNYLYRPTAHPLVEWYTLFFNWKTECERIGHFFLPHEILSLALLGQSLEKVASDKKFNTLISRLRQPDKFFATAWEIEVAASYVAQGLTVNFIEEQKIPTPDLQVIEKSGRTFWVECKNREPANNRQTRDVWRQVERYILHHLEQHRLNYQIVLTARDQLKSSDVSNIRKFILQAIQKFEPPSLLRVTGAVGVYTGDTGKYDLTVYKLSEPGVELDGDGFALPIPREHTDFGVFICNRRDLANGRKIIINPRSIQLSCAGSSRVQGVHSAFRSAINQLPQSGPGVIHVRLPLTSWTTDLNKTKMEIDGFLREKLSGNQNRRVNAVIVAIHYTELAQQGAFRHPIVTPFNIIVEHENPRT
jgi:hypothetical protein